MNATGHGTPDPIDDFEVDDLRADAAATSDNDTSGDDGLDQLRPGDDVVRPAAVAAPTSWLQHPQSRIVVAAVIMAMLTVPVAAFGGVGPWLLLVHAVAVALAAFAWWRLRDDTAAHPLMRLLALAVAGLGAVGVVGTALLVVMKRIFEARRSAEPAWMSVVAADDDDDALLAAQSRASVEATLAQQSTVVPFADVLARGTTEQKQEMISVIASNFRPPFARALRAAMNDTEPSVRMMAAAAASRIEGRFLDASMALETDWADQPTDAHRGLELAHHYDAFAATELLDENRAVEARLRALEMFQMAAQDLPRDPSIAQATIRLLLKLEREDEAISLYSQRMEEGNAPPALASWYLECLFKRRRFAELRRHAAALSHRVRDDDLLHPRSLDALRLWALGPPKSRALVPVDVVLGEGDTEAGPNTPREPRPPRPKFELPYFRPNYPT